MRGALRQLLDRFFGNWAEALALNLIEQGDRNEMERARIRKLLREEAK